MRQSWEIAVVTTQLYKYPVAVKYKKQNAKFYNSPLMFIFDNVDPCTLFN